MTSHSTNTETAKQRSLRIPLDYVRPSRFQIFKAVVALIGSVIAFAYAAWLIAGSESARQQLSPGPLVAAHVSWEQKCEACHDNFSPLRADADAGTFKLLSGFFRRRSSAADPAVNSGSPHSPASSFDSKCQGCHMPPDHHHGEKSLSVERCTACHVDHDGKTTKIAQPDDQHCTRCHTNLANPVQSFSSLEGKHGHPPFRSLQNDPGNIRFNHQLHMRKGIPAPDTRNQGLRLMTVADLLANVSPAIANQLHRPPGISIAEKPNANAPVELQCSSCHQLDTRQAVSPSQDAEQFDSAGAYMLPVRYEQHCQACHPLYYEASHTKQLQHGLVPGEIRESLVGQFWSNRRVSPGNIEFNRSASARRIPGRNSDRLSAEAEQRNLTELMLGAESYLLENKVCLKCHVYAESKNNETTQGLPDVLPANIPKVWLEKARFNHRAHLAINSIQCETCHASALSNPANGQENKPDDENVMIDGRDKCMACHTARTNEDFAVQARFDCVECHRYHVIGAY